MALGTTRVVATVGVGLFWVGVIVAGALAPGYSARDDFVSSLAARGSPVAALGVAALLALALAHAAAGLVVMRVRPSRIGARLLIATAAATAVIAVFRVNCASGAAGCGQVRQQEDLADSLHGLGVISYEVFLLAAMGAVAGRAVRRQSGWPLWMAFVSVAMAVGSVLLILETAGTEVGLWQRLWLADNLAWLLLVTWLPRTERAVDRSS